MLRPLTAHHHHLRIRSPSNVLKNTVMVWRVPKIRKTGLTLSLRYYKPIWLLPGLIKEPRKRDSHLREAQATRSRSLRVHAVRCGKSRAVKLWALPILAMPHCSSELFPVALWISEDEPWSSIRSHWNVLPYLMQHFVQICTLLIFFLQFQLGSAPSAPAGKAPGLSRGMFISRSLIYCCEGIPILLFKAFLGGPIFFGPF